MEGRVPEPRRCSRATGPTTIEARNGGRRPSPERVDVLLGTPSRSEGADVPFPNDPGRGVRLPDSRCGACRPPGRVLPLPRRTPLPDPGGRRFPRHLLQELPAQPDVDLDQQALHRLRRPGDQPALGLEFPALGGRGSVVHRLQRALLPRGRPAGGLPGDYAEVHALQIRYRTRVERVSRRAGTSCCGLRRQHLPGARG